MSLMGVERVSMRVGETYLLRDVSLSIDAGELVGLIGPNGAGKTTLLRIMAGLRRSDDGTVTLQGTVLRRDRESAVARQLAYLAQGAVCHWPLTVERVVMLGRLPHAGDLGRIGPADRAAVETAIEETDLGHVRFRRVDSLSAGERARVMLARALSTEPRLLLADEPIAALDPGHQLDVMSSLQRLAQRRLVGVVVVLHDLGLAARFCRRLILLHHGCVMADGTPEEVLTERSLAKVYGVEARLLHDGGVRVVMPWRRLENGGAG